MRRRFAAAGVLAGMLALTTTGCMDKATEPFRDAPRGSTNNRPADTMTFPDGFSSVAHKCDDNRAALAVAPNDPRCSR